MTSDRFKLVSAVHLFLLRDDQILLLRRHNTGYEDGKYSVIAGHLDGDEQVSKAAVREAKEEVGVEISPAEIQIVGVMHRKSEDERIDWFLTSSTWKGQISNEEPEKCDQLKWFGFDNLPENIIAYVRRAIENYRRGRYFDSYGWPEE
jgi:8-oxo-dGTP diphosphatase